MNKQESIVLINELLIVKLFPWKLCFVLKNRGPSYLVLYARGSKRHHPGGKGVTCVWTLIHG